MKDNLCLYVIDPSYLKFMRSLDHKVSVKNGRPFVGVITMINGIRYVLPLTSQTTDRRKAQGKNRRSASITTFVKDDRGAEIANILHNNMFPVIDGVYSLLSIDPKQDTYESHEIRFLRKNRENIIKKAKDVYQKRTEAPDDFLVRCCCDFRLLEAHYQSFSQASCDTEQPISV